MRISFDREKLGSLPENQARFYLKYSSFVLKALGKHSFQDFVCWMLRKESIDAESVKGVAVSVLPRRAENGKTIAGKCAPAQGRIWIYPKTVNFWKSFKRKFGRKILMHYAESRARAALIHELLHLKYNENEQRVRELCREYFGLFKRNQIGWVSFGQSICAMIFRAKSTEDKIVPKRETARTGMAIGIRRNPGKRRFRMNLSRGEKSWPNQFMEE
jgi:hypothetical protein